MSTPPANENHVKNGSHANDGNHTSHSSHRSHSHPSHSSHPSHPPDRVVPPRGDYRTLLSFQKAEVIYDLTFRFTKKFLSRGDRTIDQMVQAARSGKKNILEGSKAGTASKEMEIKLTTVARGSLEELLDDYLDFLRARDLRLWEKDSPEALHVREMARKTPLSYDDFREIVETRSAEVIANVAICLVNQANYLIDRQLARLDREFVEHGGLRERMTRVRVQRRDEKRRG